VNRAEGNSEIESKAAKGSGERVGKGASFNGAEGISDIEGKAVKGSGERAGKRASFKYVVPIIILRIVAKNVLTRFGAL
jgi:hypothetical protein